jgi:Dolichyl-phosphate-mannose-protein mannosyltransferase
MTNVIQFSKKHLAACLILATSLVLGFIVFGDYGIAWDEPNQRVIGQRSWDYVFSGDNTLNDFKNRDYGVAVELPLIFLEKTLGMNDTRDIYRMRHLTIHLFFLLSAFAFYFLIWFLYRNKPLAICGYLMFLLSPRIYAQSFFNSKDIPFMCMFIFCFLVFAIAFRDKKIRYFALLGILSGLLINIRIMGIVILVVVTALVLTDIIMGRYRKKMLLNYIVYLVLTVTVVVLSWPWLWQDPAGHFRIAFSNMSKFRWNNNILMNGDFVKASAVGWKYLPQWFGLTTPVIYLLLGIAGFVFLVFRFFRKSFDFIRQTINRNHLIYLVCFAGPVIAVIVLHSVLYDGWRQLYFIYPAFLLLAVYGLSSLVKARVFSGDLPKVAVSILLIVSFASIGFTMIKSHPFEDVFFNILLSKKDQYLRKTFELDYWGTSYKQALEYIVARDHSPELKIKVANLPGEFNSYILKPEDRKRIRYVESDDQADYFITNYRWHFRDYSYPKEKKIFSITIQNSEICSAWKLH